MSNCYWKEDSSEKKFCVFSILRQLTRSETAFDHQNFFFLRVEFKLKQRLYTMY